MRSLENLELKGKIALVRCDFNVQIEDDKIVDETRLLSSIATLEKILANGAGIVAMSHLGRPKEGEFDSALSLQPIATRLSELLNKAVSFKSLDEATKPSIGEIVLLENTRFNVGEKANDETLAKRYASLADVFVMDAFASSHRKEASTVAIASQAKECCAGLLLATELKALKNAVDNPKRPLVVIVGGAKVSTKLTVIDRLAELADTVVVGGGIANTFLLAKGMPVGKSLVEESMLTNCIDVLNKYPDKFILPSDVVVADKFDADANASIVKLDQVQDDQLILDTGPDTSLRIDEVVTNANTVIWNGALGVFEFEKFSQGTKKLANSLAQTKAFTLAGGGETLAAVNSYGVADKISYLSTGGGAFLEFIEGRELPAVTALK